MLPSGAEKELRRIMRYKRRPVAFVGSGMSGLGSWRDFIYKLAARADNEVGLKLLMDSSAEPDLETLLAIADESLNRLSAQLDRAEFIRKHFASDDSVEIPAVYQALVRAPFAFFVTTNYDPYIEDAYEMQWGTRLEVVRSGEPEKALRAIASGKPFVFKIHGCARSGGPFVIGYSDYQKIIFGRPPVRAALHAIFATHSLVFMGYGHRDPHVGMYLDFQRHLLEQGAPARFTFLKKQDDCGYSQGDYFRSRFGITCIEVDDWSIVEVVLDQLSFLGLRDDEVETRRAQVERFHEFIDKGRQEAAWGAVLYAHASADIGRTENCFKILETVRGSTFLKGYIEGIPALDFIFCFVCGQLLKRKAKYKEAREYFERIEALAHNSPLIRPLKSLGLRYAGMFWKDNGDMARALQLFADARAALGEGFQEELLDHRKWDAMYEGDSNPQSAVLRLMTIASEADEIGYQKCGAWCRYGAVKTILKNKFVEPGIDQEATLQKAIRAFERLDHIRGLADCYYLLAKVWHESGKKTAEVRARVELAHAMAVIADAESTRNGCVDLLAELKGG